MAESEVNNIRVTKQPKMATMDFRIRSQEDHKQLKFLRQNSSK